MLDTGSVYLICSLLLENTQGSVMGVPRDVVDRVTRLLRLCYGLGRTDVLVLLALAGSRSATVRELAGELGLTRSTIQRSLQRLATYGLVTREARRAGQGRPPYAYRLAPDAAGKLLAGIDGCLRAFVEAARRSKRMPGAR